jgi:formamidopyrimidine-DNA glycosylase
MFELPEFATLAKQINESLAGRTVQVGSLGSIAHKFVWYNRTPAEFEALTAGKRIGQAWARGKWLFTPLDPGYLLLFGECGGRMLFHPAGSPVRQQYHLCLAFQDGASFTATTQMWGAMELWEAGKEQERQYVKGMRTTPSEPAFTEDYFSALIDATLAGGKRSVKGLLTQEQLIPGLGNALAQDIMFRARLHPKHPIDDLSADQRRTLHAAIVGTVQEATALGGRYDEYDLYERSGGYARLMDSKSAGHPCPSCGHAIEKMAYLGGACYFCPICQK